MFLPGERLRDIMIRKQLILSIFSHYHFPASFLRKLLERIQDMAPPMVAPELYRPQVDFPNVPYDHLLRMAADRFPERQAIIYAVY